MGFGVVDLVSAAVSGDRVAALTALRDLLAGQLAGCDGHGAAALAREFRETVRELASISAVAGDEVDELAAARAARRGGAAG